jgi:hypothetical protein
MAQFTITIPDDQVPRVQEAFAFVYGLGSPATQTVNVQVVKDYVINDLKQFTRNAERRYTAIDAVEAIGSPQEIKYG